MTAFLLGFGIILIMLNIIAIKKEKGSFKYTLENTEKDMNDFQIEIGKLRKEIGESILDLQKEIEDIKSSLECVKVSESHKIDEQQTVDHIIDDNIIESSSESIETMEANIKIKEDREKSEKESGDILKGNSIKVEQIGNMISLGMSVEEISEKLNVGKGEVLLIKELYLK
ncbi:hypothetical protein [Clostridium lundense]|uniref:hypothetical protein n=1 Tax=Clostridium lundense TaxID=319475 RepID=UPI000556AF13|nr:hypothetical protein [Clostridium lundense]